MVGTLSVMSLKWTPAVDTLEDVEKAWVMVFLASGSADNTEADLERFRVAFKKMIGSHSFKEWPSPQDMLRLLPARTVDLSRKALPGLTLKETLLLDELSPQQKHDNAIRAMRLIQQGLEGKDLNR